MKSKLPMISIASILLFLFASCDKEQLITDRGNLVPKTVTQDPTLPYIIINDAKLHAQAFGEPGNTLIICIHGGPGANYRYMLNCKSLADKGYRVVFYDQRGSGLSQRFPAKWYKDLGANAIEKTFYDDLKGIINHYKIQSNQKVVLITQSWGSMLGTGYAGKYPDDIDGLIIAEPGGLKWKDVLEYVGNAQSLGLWSETLNDASYIDQFLTGKENQHEILDYKMALLSAAETVVGDVKSTLGPNSIYYKSARDGAVVNSVMFQIGEEYKPDFSEQISQFQKKVLIFYSGNNKAYPDSWADKIFSAYPIKDIYKVQGVGHSGMFDQLNTWTNFTEPKVLEYLNNL